MAAHHNTPPPHKVDNVRYGFTYSDTSKKLKAYRARHLLGWRQIDPDLKTLPGVGEALMTNFLQVNISNAQHVIAAYFARDRSGWELETWLMDVVRIPVGFVPDIVRGIESTFGCHFRGIKSDELKSYSQTQQFCASDVPLSLEEIPGLDKCDKHVIDQLEQILLKPVKIKKFVPSFKDPIAWAGARDPVLQLVAVHFVSALPNELDGLLRSARVTKDDALLVLECLYAKFPMQKIRDKVKNKNKDKAKAKAKDKRRDKVKKNKDKKQ